MNAIEQARFHLLQALLTVEPATNPIRVDYLIDLAQGFNLFAYPMLVAPEHSTCYEPPVTIGTVDEVESIIRHNATTGHFETCDFNGGTGFPIGVGRGLKVNMREAELVFLPGCE